MGQRESKRHTPSRPLGLVRSGITTANVLDAFPERGTVSEAVLQNALLTKHELDMSITKGSAGRPKWKKLLSTNLSKHRERELPNQKPIAYWRKVSTHDWELTDA